MPTSPPEPGSEPGSHDAPFDDALNDALSELLRPALESALEVIRAQAGESSFPTVPPSLRPLIRFAKLPARSVGIVRSALEEHPDLRQAVAGHLDERRLGRSRWLWFGRPDGWVDELRAVLEDLAADRASTTADRERRALHVEVVELRARLSAMTGSVAELEAEAAVRERSVVRLEEQIAVLHGQLEEASAQARHALDERGRAVRELKDTERRLAERLARDRRERSEAAAREDAAGPDASATAGALSPDQMSPEARLAAIRVLHAVGDQLDELHGLLAPAGEVVVRGSGDRGSASTAPRWVTLPRGLTDDSADGLRWRLSQPDVLLLIDGYNVTMRRWPDLDASAQRAALERELVALARTVPAAVHVVFDGDVVAHDPARRVGSEIRVSFSPAGVDADDVIIEATRRYSTESSVLAVSDDRRVQRGVRRAGGLAVPVAVLESVL